MNDELEGEARERRSNLAVRGRRLPPYRYFARQASRMPAILFLLLCACRAPDTVADLSAELLEMRDADQEVRDRLMALTSASGSEALTSEEGQELIGEMVATDEQNQSRLCSCCRVAVRR